MFGKADWEVKKEYQPLGAYRFRLLSKKRGADFVRPRPKDWVPAQEEEVLELDIREYVSTQTFEGFTRRGVRFPVTRDNFEVLLEVVMDVLEGINSSRDRRKVEVEHRIGKPNDNSWIEDLRVGTQTVWGPKEKDKEVLMKHCTLCKREMPALEESGIGYKEEVLCGTCLKSAQKVCPHSLKKEDAITCRDCGARPWTYGRVFRGIGWGLKVASLGFVKLFMMYTLPSIIGSAVVMGVLALVAKKMGLF